MKKHRTLIVILFLFGLSASIYFLQLYLFKDPATTGFYLLQDLAFLPTTIAVATIVVGKIMEYHEKQNRISKTRMLASSFFSDNGFKLLKILLSFTTVSPEIKDILKINPNWTSKQFATAANKAKTYSFPIHFSTEQLENLKNIFAEKRMALLIIMSNPLLFDHEDFTDMLWAILHLSDELTIRENLTSIPKEELYHLNDDIERVIQGLLANWFMHISYIKDEYPHLYLLALKQCESLCN